MKSISKRKFVSTILPKDRCTVMGGRSSAIYHFQGFTTGGVFSCDQEHCEECAELNQMIKELYEVDDGFRREWQKLAARYARVPQRSRLRAEYHRKRGSRF